MGVLCSNERSVLDTLDVKFSCRTFISIYRQLSVRLHYPSFPVPAEARFLRPWQTWSAPAPAAKGQYEGQQARDAFLYYPAHSHAFHERNAIS